MLNPGQGKTNNVGAWDGRCICRCTCFNIRFPMRKRRAYSRLSLVQPAGNRGVDATSAELDVADRVE